MGREHGGGPKRLAHHDPKRRACLGGCGRLFLSAGPGNRFCTARRKKADERRRFLSRRQTDVFRDERG